MQRNEFFQVDKINIVDFKLLKGQVETPDDFAIEHIDGHHLENTLELAFNLEDKLVKADFSVTILTDSNQKNREEAKGSFHLMFIFKVDNLEQLAIPNENKMIDLNANLGNALASISYSTSRGILITRLQGTALQNFMLPVINPNSLLYNNK
jgi:hypothetical protein